MDERWSRVTDVRQVDLEAIRDGQLVAVILRDPSATEGYRVAAYCEGSTVPETVQEAESRGTLMAPCACGAVGLVYHGYSHRMPDVFEWPTLIYRCPACGAELSFMRLSAADARRALGRGLGVSSSED